MSETFSESFINQQQSSEVIDQVRVNEYKLQNQIDNLRSLERLVNENEPNQVASNYYRIHKNEQAVNSCTSKSMKRKKVKQLQFWALEWISLSKRSTVSDIYTLLCDSWSYEIFPF